MVPARLIAFQVRSDSAPGGRPPSVSAAVAAFAKSNKTALVKYGLRLALGSLAMVLLRLLDAASTGRWELHCHL